MGRFFFRSNNKSSDKKSSQKKKQLICEKQFDNLSARVQEKKYNKNNH